MRDPSDIRDDDVARDFGVAAFVGEVLNVFERLGFGFAEVLAETFVFDDDFAAPEAINVAVTAGDAFDRFLEGGNQPAFDAEDLKEFVPESLFLGALAFRALPFAGELDGVVANFVPRNRHGG